MEQDVEQIHFWFVDFATDPVCSYLILPACGASYNNIATIDVIQKQSRDPLRTNKAT